MHRNDHIVNRPMTIGRELPMRELCGAWTSLGGSPGIRIYFTGKRYRLIFSYDDTTVFRRPIFRKWAHAYFYLYGRIDLAYDPQRDVLTLLSYGDYVRAGDLASADG